MKDDIRLGIILLIITAVSGFLLGFAQKITKEPIAIQEQKTKSEAMQIILPSATEFKASNKQASGLIKEVNEGYNGSKIDGYILRVDPKGYGGLIDMMVGISTDGKITGIKILSHSETPGLGANAPNPKFSGQYTNKPAKELKVVKGEASGDDQISALTGATITSRAVTTGVNEAVKFYDSNLKGGK
ncbi:Electron transport complex protein RnfG [Clostridium liquoris]|jgi:electron transport complex protein RnfG|uniref:Ion-translocating oxidoreductase complex subunit G n=1 Tax=Clostridium liquoris TaxID=1289519 RepID=A0A2T0B2N0_9CLOT|nr:RnfABCDGE type electron transport complex subunit G [Clostridium liquoris]PRR78135.1 Electron transport complex protein RnfG [Clostridium liquoris]